MSHLVVVGFPTVNEAEDVRRELAGLQQQHLISLEDAVVVERDKQGHVHLRQAVNLTTAGAISGGFWGSLVGLIVLNPLLGAAVGAGVGAASGALADMGINDEFMRELGRTLPEDSAALCLLVRTVTVDRVLEKLQSHAPHTKLLHTSLSHVDEQKLRDVLDPSKRPQKTEAEVEGSASNEHHDP
ncbi:DUF1269 domain-containing protein [Candidatus Synechococcus spongiarum]|uniref:DUF1269 domain-containing protein n=2 Tax=Candidatus Synechococcus spongiarum TaxID=431041 RepID=A0A1T1CSB6_9SYNE|nr:DUF1269 domain-containing protein [Candidatus Synechococcus spongiarum]OOV31313.1 hypothetical protein BV61_04690 [Candidatus Synechococcus spongiarum LMB bulk15M]OOV34044.1 hypothetical protein BV53_06510 [Candidatus Synechococcus spongiarum LMB bulk15N]